MGGRHGTQVVNRLGDLHPGCGGRGGEHLDGFVRHEQRIAGMHQLRRMLTVADQIRNVVNDRQFRMNHRMPAADAADSQGADRQ
ncbi:hypothetical protein BH11ACT7_BH11ACT7_21060 [soil metagenome]